MLFKGQIYKIESYLSLRCSVKERGDTLVICATKPELIDKIANCWRLSQRKKILKRKLNKWTMKLGASPTLFHVDRLEGKWGVCYTNKRRIVLDHNIFDTPERLWDYLIVHELCHLIHPNHKPAFWREMERVLPNYEALDDELDRWYFNVRYAKLYEKYRHEV